MNKTEDIYNLSIDFLVTQIKKSYRNWMDNKTICIIYSSISIRQFENLTETKKIWNTYQIYRLAVDLFFGNHTEYEELMKRDNEFISKYITHDKRFMKTEMI